MLKYTDITQNTYIQSRTVTEIMAREKCGLLAGLRTVPCQLTPYDPNLSASGGEIGANSRNQGRYLNLPALYAYPYACLSSTAVSDYRYTADTAR